jgi:hypothetical protein
MEDFKISPPWYTFYKEVCELFKKDNDVIPVYNDQIKTLTLKVSKYEKAKALKKLIPAKKAFGNVTVNVNIDYKESEQPIADIYRAAFENNPAFKYVFDFDAGTNHITYVIFEKEVVQFWNDDMSDPHGITSTLYENIAEDVFDTDGVIFSTDSEKDNKWTEEYYKNHATPEEEKQWEKYNGKGSFRNGKTLDGIPIPGCKSENADIMFRFQKNKNNKE